jgi:hypothetical protein
MYCPKCGNQPSSDRVRFCPSCGFRMDGVVELLVREGTPTNPLAAPEPPASTYKRRGMRRGAKILFTSFVLFPIFFAIAIAEDTAGPLIVPLTVLLMGSFWMLYYKLFGEEIPVIKKESSAASRSFPQPAYLPPDQSIPIPNRPPVETQPPHSVSEHTTRTLGRQ